MNNRKFIDNKSVFKYNLIMTTNENPIRMKLNKSIVNEEFCEAELFKSFLYDVIMKTEIMKSSKLFQMNTLNETKKRTLNLSSLNNTSVQHDIELSNKLYTNLLQNLVNFSNDSTFDSMISKMIEFSNNSENISKSSKTSITSKTSTKRKYKMKNLNDKNEKLLLQKIEIKSKKNKEYKKIMFENYLIKIEYTIKYLHSYVKFRILKNNFFNLTSTSFSTKSIKSTSNS